MGRSILAVLLGLILANVTIMAIEFAGHSVYPPPAGLDPFNPASVRAFMARMPTGAFLSLLLAWFVGTGVGGFLAARVARRARAPHALIVGGLVMAGAIANMIMIPHPAWFWVLALAAIPGAAYAGAWLANRGRASGRERVDGAETP
jgi:hypothetical protein